MTVIKAQLISLQSEKKCLIKLLVRKFRLVFGDLVLHQNLFPNLSDSLNSFSAYFIHLLYLVSKGKGKKGKVVPVLN
jgi:hypothetical protein